MDKPVIILNWISHTYYKTCSDIWYLRYVLQLNNADKQKWRWVCIQGSSLPYQDFESEKNSEVPWRELGGLQSKGSVRSNKKINLNSVVKQILKVLSFRFFHIFMPQGNYWPTHLFKSHEKNTLYLNKVKTHCRVNNWKKLPVSSFTFFWNGNLYNGF